MRRSPGLVALVTVTFSVIEFAVGEIPQRSAMTKVRLEFAERDGPP